jgi:hypothetical protein
MTYTSRAIEPFNLLQESFSQTGPIYVPLLLLAIPAQVIAIVQGFVMDPKAVSQSPLYYGLLVLSVIVSLIMTGTVMHFVYKYLRELTIDLNGAFNRGVGMFLNLFIGYVLYMLIVIVGLILLIIPGIYISVVLGFFIYAMVSENCSFMDGFKYSMDLVKGRWWATFGSMLVGVLCLLPIIVLSSILGTTGVPAIITALISVAIIPFINVYYVKLFIRMQETAGLNQ